MTDTARSIVCFGELLDPVEQPGRRAAAAVARVFDVHVGGAEANVAVSLARFGHDARDGQHRAAERARRGGRRRAHDARRRHERDRRGAGPHGPLFLDAGRRHAAHRRALRPRGLGVRARCTERRSTGRARLRGASWLHLSGIASALGERAAAANQRAAERSGLDSVSRCRSTATTASSCGPRSAATRRCFCGGMLATAQSRSSTIATSR